MKYNNAADVFPEELLCEIRKYVLEGFVYISSNTPKKIWGSVSGQKRELEERNKEIRRDYQNGKSVDVISSEWYLSRSTVYRILGNK